MTRRLRFNIDKETITNTNYRKVIFTGDHLQVVLMSLAPKESIGREIHVDTDQFFRIEKGAAMITLDDGHLQYRHFHLGKGDAFVVPARTWHDVKNTSRTVSLKLYTIYAPPHHPPGTIQRTKP